MNRLKRFDVYLQLFIEVRDGPQSGDLQAPYLNNYGILTVKASRNILPPVFNPDFYPFTIMETRPVGDTLGRVTLVDPDGDVSIVSSSIRIVA